MTITSKTVQELREKTGCGMMDCKKALMETNGDQEAAADYLRKKGLAGVAKRSDRVAAQGAVASYIHTGGKIGVLVEVNCETDFVAKNDDFQAFVKDVALQIAAQNPEYITKEEVPEAEKAFEKEVCLLEQSFIKDTKKTINDLLGEIAAKIGENIVIRRFTRYQLGEKS